MNLRRLLDEEPVIVAGVANLLVLAGVLSSETASGLVKAAAGLTAVVVQVLSVVAARRKVRPAGYAGRHEADSRTDGSCQGCEKAVG